MTNPPYRPSKLAHMAAFMAPTQGRSAPIRSSVHWGAPGRCENCNVARYDVHIEFGGGDGVVFCFACLTSLAGAVNRAVRQAEQQVAEAGAEPAAVTVCRWCQRDCAAGIDPCPERVARGL